MKKFRQLIINPGSTSTKIAVFEDEQILYEETLRHSAEELKKYEKIFDQLEFRKQIILKWLDEMNIPIDSLDCTIGRGGLLKPIQGGTYEINQLMLEHLRIGYQGEHASNLGGLLAKELTPENGCKAYIVDPVVVDELQDVARISGLKEIERISIFHALNQKAIARKYAKSINQSYESLNLIVVHLGGGISVGAHKNGKVIDCANALHGEGPFSPERTGSLPMGSFAEMCYSGKYKYDEIKKMIAGKGGLVSYLGTNSAREANERAASGDEYAHMIYYAMAYQVGKEIGAISTVFKGEVDAILLTGGIAYDTMFTGWIKEMVEFISPVHIFPGEDEMEALAQGGLRILRGEENPRRYE